MKSYLALLRHVMEHGKDREDRTGVGTRAVFGYQWRHDLRTGFPLLTTKKVHVRSVLHELLWFLSGSTNVADLQKNGVTIWNEWAGADGDLGPVYGKQWRRWEGRFGDVDQITELIQALKVNPFSRRHIVTAWNPPDVPKMALPPCHTLWQCQVEPVKGKRPLLHLSLYARSIDSFLGLPFNIASYGFLLSMLAKCIGAVPAELVISVGDLHIYRNHFEQVAEQLGREPRALPTLMIDTGDHQGIDSFYYDQFLISGYDPHPAIKAEIAV